MASVQQGEKQLFEKFWQGTFKAVATPRPESIIVASITARKPLPSTEAQSCVVYPAEERAPKRLRQHTAQEASIANGWEQGKASQELTPIRTHSTFRDKDFTPPPSSRGKKKKKKSARKKRRRSPSYSPSPVKKKKKKSSKKHKRNRSFSKKRRHSSSSPKSKRKKERKHQKQSRSRPRKSHRHRHRRCHSRSPSSESRSSSCESRHRAKSPEEGHKSRRRRPRPCSKAIQKGTVSSGETRSGHPASQSLQVYSFLSSNEVISQSRSSADLFTKTVSPLGNLAAPRGGSREYDSGNDTSSPPSARTSSSTPQDDQDKGSPGRPGCGRGGLAAGKPRLLLTSDNSSDSGNSFTTCSSQTKGPSLETLPSEPQATNSRGSRSPCFGCSEVKKLSPAPSPARTSPLRACSRGSSYSSPARSSPASSHSSPSRNHRGASPRYARSRSSSSGKRSYTRSPSYSSTSAKLSPVSRSPRPRRSPSYTRYSPTSARKRPIPYYRPSPSSSSSLSSSSSWDSSSSRSRSRSYSRSSSSRSRSSSENSSSDSDSASEPGTHSRSYASEGSYESTGR
ncbi:serine/arginine repetitive matrix protein 4 isoform X2 [Dromiciops gliroides]|uniref:serine/arginine repetitive matrix protein 4 isoform X2 n=1 Tax=Dromiciops gliroides TaxID=33562 RepID=UPI001CC808AA|nr:serine/arginine repetitive matrix protein 4 isoform X2 [Dromiciops gliroides]